MQFNCREDITPKVADRYRDALHDTTLAASAGLSPCSHCHPEFEEDAP